MEAVILVIHHSAPIAQAIVTALEQDRLTAWDVADGTMGLYLATRQLPDLIILETGPSAPWKKDLLSALKSDSRTTAIPVICLSDVDSKARRIRALELGAAEFLVHPISFRELVLRVKAILRRRSSWESGNNLRVDSIELDVAGLAVKVNQRPVSLTHREFRLLEILIRNQGRALTRDQLLEAVWGSYADVQARTVDAHIKALRAKLGEAGHMITTINRIGYCLRNPEIEKATDKPTTQHHRICDENRSARRALSAPMPVEDSNSCD